MARLAILEYPDPRLRTVAQPVTEFDAELSGLIEDMFETMYASKAIGLAASQVDVHRQVVTVDVSPEANDPRVFINPEIVSRRAIGLVEESCLSVPGIVASVPRATKLRVRTMERTGESVVRDLDGLLAVCVEHELDHLRGKLFVDHLSFFQRLRFRGRLNKESGERRA